MRELWVRVERRSQIESLLLVKHLTHRGDANRNDLVSISDAVYLTNYFFAGRPATDPQQSGYSAS
jgi:hypothetical protein